MPGKGLFLNIVGYLDQAVKTRPRNPNFISPSIIEFLASYAIICLTASLSKHKSWMMFMMEETWMDYGIVAE